MIRVRTVIAPDPLACANVLAALAGPGAPAGVASVSTDGRTIRIAFDPERTAPELIDALIEVETALVPARAPVFDDQAQATAAAARGLAEPALDATRIIETFLP